MLLLLIHHYCILCHYCITCTTTAEHTGEWADTNLFQPGSLQRHRTADLHTQLQQELTAAAAAHATAAAAAAQHAAAAGAAEAEQSGVAHTLTALTAVAAAASAALEQACGASVEVVAAAQSAAEVRYSCYSYCSVHWFSYLIVVRSTAGEALFACLLMPLL
jgi:hypothetical protein